jgi:hypothetical protein
MAAPFFAALPAIASEIAPVATVLSSAASFASSAKNVSPIRENLVAGHFRKANQALAV